MASWPVAVHALAPLKDPVALNIGLNCKWQQKCIAQQERAMKRAIGYVRAKQPPAWRVQMCNRNAARRYHRVDWVGFDNCIRNTGLRPTPAGTVKRRVRWAG